MLQKSAEVIVGGKEAGGREKKTGSIRVNCRTE